MVCLKKVPHLPCQQLASAPGVNLFIEYLTPDWVQCKWTPVQYGVSGSIRSYYELAGRQPGPDFTRWADIISSRRVSARSFFGFVPEGTPQQNLLGLEAG